MLPSPGTGLQKGWRQGRLPMQGMEVGGGKGGPAAGRLGPRLPDLELGLGKAQMPVR